MIFTRSRVVVASVVAVGLLSSAAAASSRLAKPRIGPIPRSVPALTRAGAVGTLVALDPKRAIAEFSISCGRYVVTKAKIRPGRFKVDLRGATFGWAVNYNGNGGGHVVSFGLARWETAVRRSGWRGTLYLRTPNAPRSVYLTNGGSTDVCAGVFG